MEYENYAREFRAKAENAGFSEDVIIKCLEYAKPLLDKGLPVIYTTSNLAALVGYTKTYIKRAVDNGRTNFFYRKFTILKKNGKKREIFEPLPSLKSIQLWILENVLYSAKGEQHKPSRYAKAYIKKRTIKDNARFHKGQDVVLSLDIKDFFPSITIGHIEQIFRALGYLPIIANLLAKLCCKEISLPQDAQTSPDLKITKRYLPQGAPTSPYLSNLVLKPFDDAVSKFCNKTIKYTRYADDLTFSGNSTLDKDKIISFVGEELKKLGFSLNEEKTKFMTKSQRQIVTGIVVNEKMQVPKKTRKEIRQIFFYIKKYGLDNHLEKIGKPKKNYLISLLGRIGYILFLNPEDAEMRKIREELKKMSK